MDGSDLREILVAFHEKGWNLYEMFPKPIHNLGGPVDNLVQDIGYWIYPTVKKPTSRQAVDDETNGMKRRGQGPDYTDEKGETHPVSAFVFRENPEHGFLAAFLKDSDRYGITLDDDDITLPLQDAARLIRQNLSSYKEIVAKEMEGFDELLEDVGLGENGRS